LFRDDGRDQFGLRPQAQFQNRILNEAKEIFINSTGQRYRVILGFQERSGIAPKRINEISEFLAGAIAHAVALRPPTYTNPTMIGLSDLHPFEGIFPLVQIYDFSDVFDYSWSIQNVFSVDPLNESMLNARVREKEAKRSKGLYSGINKIWLLLYMDFFDHAMDQQIPKKLSIELCPHGFDKIVIFKTLEDTCLVIYPEFTCSELA